MPRIDPKLRNAVAMVVLGCTTAWKVADRYFGDQAKVAAAIATVDHRLAVIETQLSDLREHR